MNEILERIEPWIEQVMTFLIGYLVYVFFAVIVVIWAFLSLFLQWFVNAYLNPAEPVPFFWCFISVIFGLLILGLWAWERGQR